MYVIIDIENIVLKSLNDMDAQIAVIQKYAESISNIMFNLIYNWRKKHNESNTSEADAIAQCILQMMHCKMQSFLKLNEGVTILSQNKSFTVIDISSLITIVRSMYELAFVFHNIYAEQKLKLKERLFFICGKLRD